MRPDPVLTARLACKSDIEKTITAIEMRLEGMPTAVETLALRCYELGQKSMLVLEQLAQRDEHEHARRFEEDRDTPLVEVDFTSAKTNPGAPRALKESKKFKAPP